MCLKPAWSSGRTSPRSCTTPKQPSKPPPIPRTVAQRAGRAVPSVGSRVRVSEEASKLSTRAFCTTWEYWWLTTWPSQRYVNTVTLRFVAPFTPSFLLFCPFARLLLTFLFLPFAPLVPQEVIIVEDDNGEIVREQTKDTEVIAQYKTMRETIVYLTNLNYEDTEAIMLEKLDLQVNEKRMNWLCVVEEFHSVVCAFVCLAFELNHLLTAPCGHLSSGNVSPLVFFTQLTHCFLLFPFIISHRWRVVCSVGMVWTHCAGPLAPFLGPWASSTRRGTLMVWAERFPSFRCHWGLLQFLCLQPRLLFFVPRWGYFYLFSDHCLCLPFTSHALFFVFPISTFLFFSFSFFLFFKRFLVSVIKDLLRLCEEQRGKDNKAVVASNIMYIVGKSIFATIFEWCFC